MDGRAVTIRPVVSLAELEATFDVVGAEVVPSFTHTDRRFAELARAYPADRELMLLSEHDAQIVGGALAFRDALGTGAKLRVLAVRSTYRGQGVGTALMEALERAAALAGVHTLVLGAVPEARTFYRRLGYTGRSAMHKSLASAGARYADGDERRQRLEELRRRRAARG